MMDIIIQRGTYGHRISKNRIKPVSVGERVSVSNDEADRLVQMGIAFYADAPVAANNASVCPLPAETPQDGQKASGRGLDTTEDESPKNAGQRSGCRPQLAPEPDASDDETELLKLEKMSKSDLEQMAKDMGVDISDAKNNHERAALILAADTESSEDVPDLTGDIVR